MNKQAQKIAIIGGTGLSTLDNVKILSSEEVKTLYGMPSAPISHAEISHVDSKNINQIVFLARHGVEHTIAPHKVNYRANIAALKQLNVTHIIAINAVGGIADNMLPGSLVIPDQIVDYTAQRINTFFDDGIGEVTHIDFSYPYNENLRQQIYHCAEQENIDIINGATYAVTEGPRLETASEIQRLKKDGCDIVGMTAMPEAALAREMEMDYASICVNANWAAGLSNDLISMDLIEANIVQGMQQVKQLLARLLTQSL